MCFLFSSKKGFETRDQNVVYFCAEKKTFRLPILGAQNCPWSLQRGDKLARVWRTQITYQKNCG